MKSRGTFYAQVETLSFHTASVESGPWSAIGRTGQERRQRSFWCKLDNSGCPWASVCWEASITVQRDNSEASCVSSPGRDARRGPAALLLLAAVFSSTTAAAQRTPQPIFTELSAYDPVAPSQLLGKWLISSQLDSKLQPLRVGVVEDRIGKTVGRITVQEGDGLAGANEAMLEARRYICSSEGSRAA